MKEEFNLSEKQKKLFREDGFNDRCYLEEDVKEFIKRLKEEIAPRKCIVDEIIRNKIETLAGDKLNGN